jgi:hypothetical protein
MSFFLKVFLNSPTITGAYLVVVVVVAGLFHFLLSVGKKNPSTFSS